MRSTEGTALPSTEATALPSTEATALPSTEATALPSAEVAAPPDLGRLLRELRRRQARLAGERRLSYRELAERTGWSHGIVGEYFTGRVLPPTDRFDTLIRLLGATPAEQGALATVRDRLEEQRRSPTTAVTPRELPEPGPVFVARTAELARLDELALEARRPIVVSGMAGVGKTTLVLHWAEKAAASFPDGQLYLNLRGFHPGRSMPVDEALPALLGKLGVTAGRLPAGVPAQVGLYRSLLSGKRMLIVLDNVADAEQARPLLPPAGCLAVVTSRHQLTGLVVTDGARPVGLGLLDHPDARNLFTQRLDPGRLAHQDAAVERIVTACGRLPLALAVVAARCAVNPTFPLTDIAAELDRASGGLEAVSTDDPQADVRAAFSWSYRRLDVDTRRVFRLIGLHPGPDVTAPVAAALGALPAERTRAALAELARAQLVTEHLPGRYACHDLLRAYAREQVRQADPPAEAQAALDRLVTHVVHTAGTAALALDPVRKPIDLPATDHPDPLGRPADETAALAWFRAEHGVLSAILDLAVRAGMHRRVWQLAWALADYLGRCGNSPEWVAVQTEAIRAGERLDDRAAQAFSHRSVAGAYIQLGRPDEALSHLDDAYALYLALDDLAGAARCQHAMAWSLEGQARWAEAIGHGERALELFRHADDAIGQGRTANSVGHYYAQIGRYDTALDRCREALRLQRGLDDRIGAAGTLDSLGTIQHDLAHHDEAVGHFREALQLHQELGDRFNEAATATRLGDTLLAADDRAAAHDAWRRALDILDGIGHPDAAGLRERLATPVPDARS
ncbi:ATP-binding protein [Micromonosporaceae bacterium Da 78-11]